MAVTVAATTVGATVVATDLVGVLHVIIHGRSLDILMHVHQEHFIGELSDFYLRKL